MTDCINLIIEDTTSWHNDVFDHPTYEYRCKLTGEKSISVPDVSAKNAKNMNRLTKKKGKQTMTELQCSTCAHSNVCMYKDDYIAVCDKAERLYINKEINGVLKSVTVKDLGFCKSVKIECVHYRNGVNQTLNTLLRGDSIQTKPIEITAEV